MPPRGVENVNFIPENATFRPHHVLFGLPLDGLMCSKVYLSPPKLTCYVSVSTNATKVRSAGPETAQHAPQLAKATLGNIRQNLFFAFVQNAGGLPNAVTRCLA